MKKILIISNNMDVGGVQKSLIALLQYMDYSSYSVDLLLLNNSGIFINKIPEKVHLLPEIITSDLFLPAGKSIRKLLYKKNIKLVFVRCIAAVCGIFDKGLAAYILSRQIPELDERYDTVIDYCGQSQLYYMVDKVKADKKISYFHNDYKKWSYYKKIDRLYYKYVDAIVTVSDNCVVSMKEVFPEYKEKIYCIENIITEKIINMFDVDKQLLNDNDRNIKIVTVGRVGKDKGFDIAVAALQLLIRNGYTVKWYFVGPVADKKFVFNILNQHDLKNYIEMVGATENPYQFMKSADIYVHPSRFEGKSIAVEEAKILHCPIVLTNYSTAEDQICNNKTGLIVNMDSESVYAAVVKIIEDKNLRDNIIKNLQNECTGNENEINKLYAII